MGDLDLTALRNATKWALDNRSNITDSQLERWINWSYVHISQPKVHRHQPLQAEGSVTLVLDEVQYDIPTELGYALWGIYGVWYVEGSSITDRTLRRQRLRGGFDVRSTDEGSLGQGRPTRYSVWGQTATSDGGQVINLDRRPSAGDAGRVLLVRGYRTPTLLTDDTHTTVLNPLWDEVIVVGATWRGFRELGENARAEVNRQSYGLLINEQQDSRRLDAEDWGGGFEVDLIYYMPIS
jgi:hypothetical protein